MHNEEFKWTEAALNCPNLKYYIESCLKFLGEPFGRVTIIKTDKNSKMNDHIDTKRSEIGSIQYKFRTVLKGNHHDLYFIDNNSIKQFVNSSTNSYIIDGGHPHGMLNTTDETRYTLAIGSPWLGKDLDTDLFKRKIIISRPETILDSWCDLKRLEN